MSISFIPTQSTSPIATIQPPVFSEAEDFATIAFYQALPSAQFYERSSLQFPSFDNLPSLQDQAAAIRTQLRNYDLTLIYEINISNRELTIVPLEVALCRNLLHLDLSNNQLQHLPPDLPQTLIALNLSNNHIQSLPDSGLPILRDLFISNNQLSELPLWIFNSRYIHVLVSDHNPFTPQTTHQIQTWIQQTVAATPNRGGFVVSDLSSTHETPPAHEIALDVSHHIPHNRLRDRRDHPYSNPARQPGLPTSFERTTVINALFYVGLLLWNERHVNHFNTSIQYEPLLALESLSFKHNLGRYLEILSTSQHEDPAETTHYVCTMLERAATDEEFRITISKVLMGLITQINAWSKEHCIHCGSPISGQTETLLAITIEDVERLQRYLFRLRELPDYIEGDAENIIRRVAQMLQLASTNPKFKKEMLTIITDGLESCVDRLLYSFNDIEVLCQYSSSTPTQLPSLCLAQGRYEWIKKFAREVAFQNLNSHEEIQTELFFLAFLRKRLSLPISTKRIRYPGCSGVYSDQVDEMELRIQKLSEIDLLSCSSFWLNQQETRYPENVEKIKNQYVDLLIQAQELCNLPSQDRKSRLQACGDPLLISILHSLFENDSQTLYDQAKQIITETCNQHVIDRPRDFKQIKERHTFLLRQAQELCNLSLQERENIQQFNADPTLISILQSLIENNSSLLYAQASELIMEARNRALASVSNDLRI